MARNSSRSENSTKNIISSIFSQVIVILFGFIVRSVFVKTLGKQYLGINGLFSNFISMLSLTELGIGTAITFKLYKPLSTQDTDVICKYMNLFRMAYRIIGIVMLIVGLLFAPLIPYLIKGDTSFFNVYIVFGLYLLQSVSTYVFFAYKSALLKADQKSYVVTNITTLVFVIEYILQIVTLKIFYNFYLYCALTIIGNLCINLIISLFVDKRYSFLSVNKKTFPARNDVKELFKDCYALSLYKVNAVVLKSIDNVVLSKFIGLGIVGLYSNYMMIYNHLKNLSASLYEGILASLGDLYAEEDENKTSNVFKEVNYLTFVLFGIAAVGIYSVINPFIELWLGSEYLLNESFVIFFALEFYIYGLLKLLSTFRSSMGLFQQGKYRPILGSLINVVLSVALVSDHGIAGVIFATVFANISTYYIIDSIIVFKKLQMLSLYKYHIENLVNLVLILACGFVIRTVLIAINSALVKLLIGGILSILLPFCLMYLLYSRKPEFKAVLSRILKQIHKICHRIISRG